MTTEATASPRGRKLIEVALPLEAINRASAREKSIRHGHPSTLHLWWSRKPLATARAVLFAQLVDDPSARPGEFPTEEAQAKERERLFRLIERMVVWENTTDEVLFRQAHEEILRSTGGNPPPILDPFASGGSIPLEAQRLGLEAHASDLNPVAVLINKALIEIPPKWAGRPPVFPGAAEFRLGEWPRASGLAEDVRRYGQWMRDEAERRIGHLYPKAKLADGSTANVIAWIWARTVRCPNPACGIEMPLYNKRWLGKKKGKEAYVVPRRRDGRVEFGIGHDPLRAPTKDDDGTVTRTGVVCVACGTAAPLSYVRAEGKAKRTGARLMAVAAEGKRQRHYLAPTPEHEAAAEITGTWPMRTDNASRLRGQASNALASSVVLARRPRADHAGATSRKSFLLAEVLDEQEGDSYADTRFCVKWFRQHGFDEGDSGAADNLSRATNTTLTALQRGGIFRAVAGRARLLGPDDLGDSWDPLADSHISDWEVALRLARAAARSGTETAAVLMARADLRRDLDTVKELGYLLYNVCQQKRWTDAGLLFNGLVTSWADIESRSRRAGAPAPAVTQAFGLVGLEDV